MEMVWDWKSTTSLLATIVFIRTVARDFIPPELHHFLQSLFARILSSLRPTFTFYIDEFNTTGIYNELFGATQSYLSTRCLSEARVLRLSKTTNSKSMTSSLPASHSTTDVFEGVQMKWSYHSDEKSSKPLRSDPHRYFMLKYHGRRREMLHSRYLDHILEEDAALKLKSRSRWLYTNRGGNWSSVRFDHPSTFDTLAIDPDLRDSIHKDLLRFSSRRDYYSRVGRAWKRGYLLHGPPGTGKTSLIAAIANLLKFDLYDLELTNVVSNTDLRSLLLSTSSKSVIVIEDIDCSLDLFDRRLPRKKKIKNRGGSASSDSEDELRTDGDSFAAVGASLNLSGVLNFVDGLWSSCVGERLMIFTTNHPERLDPALLRPGRMDRKIHLSYCEPPAFRILARNYLEIDEEGHETMKEIEALLREVKVTPADIAEIFMGCDDCGADVGLRKVVEELQKRKEAVMSLPPQTADGGVPENEEKVSGGARVVGGARGAGGNLLS